MGYQYCTMPSNLAYSTKGLLGVELCFSNCVLRDDVRFEPPDVSKGFFFSKSSPISLAKRERETKKNQWENLSQIFFLMTDWLRCAPHWIQLLATVFYRSLIHAMLPVNWPLFHWTCLIWLCFSLSRLSLSRRWAVFERRLWLAETNKNYKLFVVITSHRGEGIAFGFGCFYVCKR